MSMIKTYMPNALMRAVSDVVKAHPLEKKGEGLSDNDLMKLLERIDACTPQSIKVVALSLLPKEIMALCKYFPHNKFQKSLENIETAISLNIKQRYYEELILQWQKYPHNRSVLKLLAQYDEMEIRGNSPKIPIGQFKKWFLSNHCFAEVNKYVKKASKAPSYEEQFQEAGLLPQSPLQTVCFIEFLTGCDLRGFVKVGDNHVARCVRQADTGTAERILLNLLICGDKNRMTLKTFQQCFEAMLNMWKTPFSEKFPAGQQKAKDVFLWLYNYIEMENGFSADTNHRRRNFWEQYLDRCEVVRIKQHGMIVFHFKSYCAVEFEVVGRIFIYEKNYLKKIVLPYALSNKTQDTKRWMLNESNFLHEQTHQGNWESEAASAVRIIL